ncbi:uncharacterized protein BT62DRAFT_999430 [Guyanagaster necrorhizus]|uniref:Uncharacterized protein n=1 Tax=Guyanagaster necrorhizus TaxID=856835 RepID=A0A9P8AY01_9AGAR|nr:uncharacterized protein BT62DRAFT_999430 [Guyanagaster necrorhizus MCA 3950]KAG7451746.1 hypothetical protein BT62DRAFT_999430 [Guyanagaster necrorhizus MCA 3950]
MKDTPWREWLQRVNGCAQGPSSSVADTNPREQRKKEITRSLSSARISTAGTGRSDKKLEGEKKIRGVKRKFDANEQPVEHEKNASLALLIQNEKRRQKDDSSSAIWRRCRQYSEGCKIRKQRQRRYCSR